MNNKLRFRKRAYEMNADFFTKGRNIVICWIAFLAWGTFLFNFSLYPKIREYSNNTDLPEEKLGFTPEFFYEFLNKIGEAGRAVYFNFQFLDYLNAILMGLVLFGTLYYFLNKIENNGMLMLLLVLPITGAVFDILENTTLIYLISAFPTLQNSLVDAVSFFTSSKLTMVSLALLCIVVLMFFLLARIVYTKFSKND